MKQLFIFLLLASTTSLWAQDSLFASWKLEVPHEKVPGEIRILDWNIRMLPRLVFRERIGTMKRARRIPEEITKDSPDIIVFEEGFDVRARRILKRRLHEEYPYKIGPLNNKFFRLKTNGGVLMYSKYPLTLLEQIKYNECDRENCLSRKGAMLVETTINGHTFQVMGTHMNAGGSEELKKSQILQVLGLIRRHQKQGVPQFLCGDYNIHNDEKGGHDLYQFMVDTLGVTDGPLLSTWKYTSGGKYTDVNDKDKTALIDFIFFRSNGVEPEMMDRYVRIYRKQWADNHYSLSDHHAVLMQLKF